MPEQPLVSIIIPVYNAGKYIAETIDSALKQTWPNKEVLIVDDGSTDDSLSVAKSYESDWVKVYSQKNKGASTARNKGLAEARGRYIQFLDADDILSADKIAEQVNLLQSNPGKIAVCNTVHFFNGTKHTDCTPSPYEESFLINAGPVPFLINLWGGGNNKGSMVQPNAWLTPKAIIDKAGPWNEELTVDDDGEFFCRVILNSTGIVKSGGLSYYRKYRGVKTSLSAQLTAEGFKSGLKAVILKRDFLLVHDNSEAVQRAMHKQFLGLAIRTYLVHPQLYTVINKELKKYPNYDYNPIIGGAFINYIVRILGWRTARQLQYYYAKLFRR